MFLSTGLGAEDCVIRKHVDEEIEQVAISDDMEVYDSKSMRKRVIRQHISLYVNGDEAKVRYDLKAYDRTTYLDPGKQDMVQLFGKYDNFLINTENAIKIINQNLSTNAYEPRSENDDIDYYRWRVTLLVVYRDRNRNTVLLDRQLDVTNSVAKIYQQLSSNKLATKPEINSVNEGGVIGHRTKH